MDRRKTLAALAALVAGCGGGGGDSPAASVIAAPTPAPAPGPNPPPPPPPPPAPVSQNIAAWGDSLTPWTVLQLGTLYPTRTIFNGGVAGETSVQIAARVAADTAHRGDVTVFWMGRNNYLARAQVLADVAAGVALLDPGNTRFIVMSVLNGNYASEYAGQSGHTAILQLNADFAAAYPSNFLDIRSHLVGQFDPGVPQDVIDNGRDIVPGSLRSDNIHLTMQGYMLVAQQVKAFIDARGW